jgi:acyl-CoA thioesterase-1
MNLRSFLLSLVFAVRLSAQVLVINDGFPGENTSELDARLDGSLQKFKPDYVVLLAGGNDALNEKKFSPAERDRGSSSVYG